MLDVSRQSESHNNPLLTNRAIAVARAALEELGDGDIGEHIGVSGLGRNVATHRFAADLPGYPGWEWNAVVACAAGSTFVTINEVALMPAPTGEALQAPEWVPYSDRLRPGDLKPGDLMPPAPDDERLTDDPDDPDAVHVGNNRKNWLTRTGLHDATQRWRTGDYGPTSESAEKAQLACKTCAFFLPLADPVGQNYGVCANEYSADGVVVHATYGCGAHSQTTAAAPGEDTDPLPVYDDERPIF